MDPKLFAASLNHNIYNIDLHGSGTVSDALDQFESELFYLYESGIEHARVIYGIGKGVLAKEVQKRMDEHPLVEVWEGESSGGSAILVIAIKKLYM